MPVGIDEAFAFFADAGNLERLTPPWLRFRILTPGPITMGIGTLIEYRLRVRGVPMRWRTEIIAWEPPAGSSGWQDGTARSARFIDLQVRGPYRWWHHEHLFEERPGGTLVTDHVEYRAPLHRLVDPLLVRADVASIFDYRAAVLTEQVQADHAARRRLEPTAPARPRSTAEPGVGTDSTCSVTL